jgi:hypothetical protein
MRHLAQGMHTAIRATRGLAVDFLFENLFQILFQVILDCAQTFRLGLPTGKIGAVVL